MPHYYIHQRSHAEFIEDPEGGDYLDLREAIEDAVIAARQIMADRVKRGFLPDGSRFEITTPDGALLAVVPFAETVSESGELNQSNTETWMKAGPNGSGAGGSSA